jgi:hypothetical protein
MLLGGVAGRAGLPAGRWRGTLQKGPPPRVSGGPPNRATRQESFRLIDLWENSGVKATFYAGSPEKTMRKK